MHYLYTFSLSLIPVLLVCCEHWWL